MRKTSTYARKQRAGTGIYNGAEAFNAIQRCRGYTTEPVPGMKVEGTQSAATKAMLLVRESYHAMLGMRATEEDFDILAHGIGVATLRAIDIAGEDDFENPMLRILNAATNALQRADERQRRVGRWGFDGPGIDEVLSGVELYETILQSSSPAQMEEASLQRQELLAEQKGEAT